MLSNKSPALLPLLMMMLTLSYLSSGLFIPSLPTVELFFHTTPNLTKLTLASYLLGMGSSQLLYGPLSDAYGRRTPFIIGLLCLCVGAGICTAADSIQKLILGRMIQGFGAGGGISLTRAVLRDCYSGKDLARVASYFTINAFIFASSSPLFGSLILENLGWRWVFALLTFASAATLLTYTLLIPETNRNIDSSMIQPKILVQNTKNLFTDRVFLIYSFITYCAFCSLMGWLTLSSMLIQKHYGYTATDYGVLMFAIGWVNAIGGAINSRLTAKILLPRLIQYGLYSGISCAIILLITQSLHFSPLWLVLSIITLFTFGFTFVFANSFALAFSEFEQRIGLASSGFAFFQALGGVTGSVLMSFSPDNTLIPFALMLLVSFTLASIVARFTKEKLNTI